MAVTKTKIEWTDATWSPIRGCSRISAGCEHCYAERMAHRFSGKGQPYEGLTRMTPQGSRWTGEVRLIPEMLDLPLRWRTPRRVFVNPMSDLFHEGLAFEDITRVFYTIRESERHQFQILTKRPKRAKGFMELESSLRLGFAGLRNLWLGVSCSTQSDVRASVPLLLQTPAAVRFVSLEPLLEPVDLERFIWGIGADTACYYDRDGRMRRLRGAGGQMLTRTPLNALHWVIVGGESGPRARPCEVEWIRSIVEQCKAAGVPCFVKQLGARPIVDDEDWLTERPDGTWERVRTDRVGHRLRLACRKGADTSEWPEDLRVQEFPR